MFLIILILLISSRIEHFSEYDKSITDKCETMHTTCIENCLKDDQSSNTECQNKCHAGLSTCSQMKRQDKLERLLYDMENRENQSKFIQEFCDLNNDNTLLKQSIKKFNDKTIVSVKILGDWKQNNNVLIENMNTCKNKLTEILNYRSINLFKKIFKNQENTEHDFFDHDIFENLYFINNKCLKKEGDVAKHDCLNAYIILSTHQRDQLMEYYRNIYYNYIRINQLLENTQKNINDLDNLIDLIDYS